MAAILPLHYGGGELLCLLIFLLPGLPSNFVKLVLPFLHGLNPTHI